METVQKHDKRKEMVIMFGDICRIIAAFKLRKKYQEYVDYTFTKKKKKFEKL